MEIKLFKVESADSGGVYTIRMDSSDPSITKFKSQLALFVSIPPPDQILLIGPPYKKLSDAQLGPQTDAQVPQRIFLYNRQILTGELRLPQTPRLSPLEIGVPDVESLVATTSDVSALLEKASSPLLRALPDFERQFLRNLKRGEHYFSVSEQILAACRRCVGEQGVQIDALQAALSNLKDHYAVTKTAFESAQEKLTAQQEKHQALLDSFDNDLERLRGTPLHHSLVNTLGGIDAVYSIANTGVNLMSASGATENPNLVSSPLSPSVTGSRTRSSSISDDIENLGRQSRSNSRAGGAISPVMRGIPSGQQQALTQQSQDVRRKSFSSDTSPGPGTGSQLEVGSFDEAYPFQTGEVTLNREDYAPSDQVTLYDCVPVEKERAWAGQCGEVHRKVEEKLSQLLLVFRHVSAGLEDIYITPLDTLFFQSIFKALESNLQEQRAAMSKLREDYQFVYDTLSLRASMLIAPASLDSSSSSSSARDSGDKQVIEPLAITGVTDEDILGAPIDTGDKVDAVIPAVSSSDAIVCPVPVDSIAFPRPADEEEEVMALLRSLESRRKIQETEVISRMVGRCEAMMEVKETVAMRKGELVGTVFSSMKAIASVQTDIQFKLKKGLELMKKWHQGHNKYFIHLEHVAKLPEAYDSFLREIGRRQNFNKVYESRIIALAEEVAGLRVAETSAREGFMRSFGTHLPPIFLHMVPSLKDKPPYFDPHLTEAQWLPDVDPGHWDSSQDPYERGNYENRHDADAIRDVRDGREVGEVKDSREGSRGDSPVMSVDEEASRLFSPVPSAADVESKVNVTVPTAAEARCLQLEEENASLLRRIQELTAMAAVPRSESAVDSEDKRVAGPFTTAAAAVIVVPDASIPQDNSIPQSDHKEDKEEGEVLTVSREVSLETQAVFRRLQSIKKLLDNTAIKSLLEGTDSPHPALDGSDSGSSLSTARSSNQQADTGGGVDGEEHSDPLETLSLLERVTRALLGRIESQRSILDRPQMTISYREFHLGSLALFMPLSPKMDVYLAFNSKCPHHYLSEESLHLIRSSDRRPPPRLDFIIGRVVFLEQLVAVHSNPYSLAPGSKYHLLHVEEIEPSRPSSAPPTPVKSAQSSQMATPSPDTALAASIKK